MEIKGHINIMAIIVVLLTIIVVVHADDVSIMPVDATPNGPDVTIDDSAPDSTEPVVTIDDPAPEHKKKPKPNPKTPVPTPDTPVPTPDTPVPTPDTPVPPSDAYPLTITADTSIIYVGQLTDIKFTVIATYPDSCGPNKEPGIVCAQVITELPEPSVNVRLEGVVSKSGITDNNGNVIISVNVSSEGTIVATASKSGYKDSSVTINAETKPGPSPSTPTPSRNSGNSGQNGNKAVISNEPYDNIAQYETITKNLVSNQTIDYSFRSPEFSIYKVFINGKNNEYDIPVRIDSLKNKSIYAKKLVPGTIYKNENILIGTKRINYVVLKFRVKNSWISDNKLGDDNPPRLLIWNGTTWLILATNTTGKDDTYTYYDVPKVGRFSLGVFAISALPKKANKTRPITLSTDEDIIIPEIEEIDTPNKVPGFDIIITIIGIIISITYIVIEGKIKGYKIRKI